LHFESLGLAEGTMPILEDAKKTIEEITGYARPKKRDPPGLMNSRKAHLFSFEDDGRTPNNPALPLIHYRTPVILPHGLGPAALFEELFASNGWKNSWRNGVYDFLHFHTRTHEVLGIARGSVRVEFGGAHGRTIDLKAGDVVILPVGTGHRRRRAASHDLLVVGAYPPGGKYDEPKPSDVDPGKAVLAIAKVRLPNKDPVFGETGPLTRIWDSRG
jgi:uncharacterized protein YjlB